MRREMRILVDGVLLALGPVWGNMIWGFGEGVVFICYFGFQLDWYRCVALIEIVVSLKDVLGVFFPILGFPHSFLVKNRSTNFFE